MAACLAGTAIAACGEDGAASRGAGAAHPHDNHGGGAPGDSAATMSAGSGSEGASSEGFGGSFSTGNGANGTGGIETCGGETSQAELVPLDMYILLDSSGSMAEATGAMGQGISKWDAVRQALSEFFADPQSDGLGVGLQYFPVLAPSVPPTCTSNAQCGVYGPCFLHVCTGQSNPVCTSNADCGGGNQCVALGSCESAPANLCIPVGGQCAGNQGQCVAVTTSYCVNQDSCAPVDYATPAVEIDTLLGAGPALVASMNAKSPGGGTPTAAALAGAIYHAQAWAAANPTHTVIAVLATDGFPTECAPQDIPSIAQIAAAGVTGAPSVRTFVVGVFSGDDQLAQSNLDQLAQGGGTEGAFLIDADQDVTQAFIDALNAIRGTKLACEFQIPQPSDGGMLDFNKVNVEHTPPGAETPTTILHVASAADCDPVTGGWYYDVDPATGGEPTKIITCAATCAELGAGGQIDIRVGCETVLAPPK